MYTYGNWKSVSTEVCQSMKTKHYDEKTVTTIPVLRITGQPIYYIYMTGRNAGLAQL